MKQDTEYLPQTITKWSDWIPIYGFIPHLKRLKHSEQCNALPKLDVVDRTKVIAYSTYQSICYLGLTTAIIIGTAKGLQKLL